MEEPGYGCPVAKVLGIHDLVGEIMSKVASSKSMIRFSVVNKICQEARKDAAFARRFAESNEPAFLGFLVDFKQRVAPEAKMLRLVYPKASMVEESAVALRPTINSSLLADDRVICSSDGCVLTAGFDAQKNPRRYYASYPCHNPRVYTAAANTIPKIPFLEAKHTKNTYGQFGVLRKEGLAGMSFFVKDAPECSDSGPADKNVEDIIDLELNLMPWDPEMTYSPIVKIPISKGPMAKNPWFYGAEPALVDKEVAENFYNWLSVTEDVCLESWWIQHSFPSYKNIAGNVLKSVFPRRQNFSDDLFDVAIRRFGQRDRNMYGQGVKLRWMQLFETDFAKKVMNDEDYLNNKSIRLQITGKSEEYDISNCRMVAVPHKCNDTWSAYLWDMKDRIVHVIDPTFHMSRACELNDLHEPIVLKLHDALQQCFRMSYVGWEVDWESWKKYYVQPFLPEKTSTDSGMLTLLALRQFNGTRFEVPQTEVSLTFFARSLLYDLLNLEGNLGILPDVFIQGVE